MTKTTLNIKDLKQGAFFLENNETYLVLGQCRSHPKSVQTVKLNGAEIRCWLHGKEVEQLLSVTLTWDE